MIKKENVEQVNRVVPEAPGMRVLYYALVPTDKVKSRTEDGDAENSRQTDKQIVADFERLIRKKMYNPVAHIPPCVTEDLTLVSGEHKLQAHIGEDIEFIEVAIVEFFDYNDMKADYWKANWQSLENDDSNRPFVQNPRNKEQIKMTTIRQINKKLIKPNVNDIEKSLNDQKVRKDQIPHLVRMIMSDLKKDNSIPISYDDKKRKKYIKKKFDNVTVSTYNNIQVNYDDNSIYFAQEFKRDAKHDKINLLILSAVYRARILYPSANIYVLVTVNSHRKEKIVKIRNMTKKMFPEFEQFILDAADVIKNNKLEVNTIDLPQLPNEIKNEIKEINT